MSWSLTLNGHQDDLDQEALERMSREVVDTARVADVGLSYATLLDANGSRSIPLEDQEANDDTGREA